MSKYSLRPVHKPGKELKDVYKISVPSRLYISLRTNTRDLWHLEDENGKMVAVGRLSPAQDEVQNKVLQVTHEFKDLFGLNFTDSYGLRRAEAPIRNATEVIIVEKNSQNGLQFMTPSSREFWRGVLTYYLFDKLVSPGLCIEELKAGYQTRSFKIKTVSNSDFTYGPDAPLEVHSVSNNCGIRLGASTEASYGQADFSVNREGLFGLDAELDKIDRVLKDYGPADEKSAHVIFTSVLIVGSSGTGKTLVSSRVSQLPWARTVTLSEADFNKTAHITLPRVFMECLNSEPCLIRISDLGDHLAEQGKSLERALRKALNVIHDRKVLVIAETDDAKLSTSLSNCFDETIVLAAPNENARRDLLLHKLNSYNVTKEASAEIATIISQKTPGYTGQDIVQVVRRAIQSAQSRVGNKHDHNIDQDPSKKVQTSTANILSVTLDDLEQARLFISPSALMDGQALKHRKVRWADIGGQEEIKRTVEMSFEWPLKYPERFKALGIPPTKGLLLYGPPGCSKTMTALALATEAKLNFIPIKGPELLSKFVGESEWNLRNVFSRARNIAPCVIFFDEIDSIGSSSGDVSGDSRRGINLVSTFLSELDGVNELKGVSVLGATNAPWEIDEALLRPGRFDGMIYVKLPDEKTRKQILQLRLDVMQHDSTIDLDGLVLETEGCSGAEVVDLCHNAALEALQTQLHLPETRVEASHFEKALRQLRRSTSPELVARFDAFANRSHRV